MRHTPPAPLADVSVYRGLPIDRTGWGCLCTALGTARVLGRQAVMGTDQPARPLRGQVCGWLVQLSERVPGGSLVKVGVDAAEHAVDQLPMLAWLRRRVIDVEEAAFERLRARLNIGDPPTRPAYALMPLASPSAVFAALLSAAEDQSPVEARAAQTLRVVLELVPDEARILRLLSDGSEHPVLQAHDGRDHIVVNQSSVGRSARVHAMDLTPIYVTHLLKLGLVELCPYTGADLMEFELLESATATRSVLSPYDHRKLVKPRVLRQVVRMSDTGRKFYDACTT